MKIRLGLLALMLLMAFTQTKAQYNEEARLSLNIKGALNIATLRGNYPELANPKSRLGFLAGVDVDYSVWHDTYGWAGEIYLSSGLNFATKGASSAIKGKDRSMKLNYIILPLHVGYKQPFGDIKMKMHGGFYLAQAISADYDNGTNKYNLMNDKSYFELRKFEYGFGGGVGMEYKQLDMGVNVDYGITNLRVIENDWNIQNLNVYVSVGYRLNLK